MNRDSKRNGVMHRCHLTEEPVGFRIVGSLPGNNSGVEYVIIEMDDGARVIGRQMRDMETRSDFKHSDYLISADGFYVLCPWMGQRPMDAAGSSGTARIPKKSATL